MTAKAEQKSFATSDETREFERGTLDLLRIGGTGVEGARPCSRAGQVTERVKRLGHRPVRGAALPVPRAGRAARGHGRWLGVRRPARRRHRPPPGPRCLGGRRRAGGRGRLVRRQQLRPELSSAEGVGVAAAQSAKLCAGAPVTLRTVEVTISGWVTNRSQVSRVDAANPGSPRPRPAPAGPRPGKLCQVRSRPRARPIAASRSGWVSTAGPLSRYRDPA